VKILFIFLINNLLLVIVCSLITCGQNSVARNFLIEFSEVELYKRVHVHTLFSNCMLFSYAVFMYLINIWILRY